MNEGPDISTPEHIGALVHGFYGRVRVDPLLGGTFNGGIGDRWPVQLEMMYSCRCAPNISSAGRTSSTTRCMTCTKGRWPSWPRRTAKGWRPCSCNAYRRCASTPNATPQLP